MLFGPYFLADLLWPTALTVLGVGEAFIYIHLQRLFCHVKPAKEFKPWNTAAVPPPESYSAEPVKKKGPPPGMDMAIKWSNVYEDNGEDAPKAHTEKAQFLPPEEQLSDSGLSFSAAVLSS